MDIVPRGVIGIDDFIQGKQSNVIVIGKMNVNLRGQDVIVIVEQSQVFHQAEANLENNSAIRPRWRRLPSRWSKEW